MINIIIFVVILGILVLIHELGHFLAALKSGVRVDEFAIGFPPNIYSYQKDEIKYMINLIPFGGYVKIHGEDGSDIENHRSFASKSTITKIFILSAGVIMNMVLGAVILSIVFMLGMPVVSQNAKQDYPYSTINTEVYVYEVPANHQLQTQIELGDKIISVNNLKIDNIQQFKDNIQHIKDQSYTIKLQRKNEFIETSAKSIFNQEKNEWQLGVDLIEGQIVKYPFYLALPMGIIEMFRMMWMMISALLMIIQQLVVNHTTPTTITGPIGIYKITAEASSMGLVYLLQIMSILSINLAIINYLPLPALDGGRVLFIVSEKLFGRRISTQTENLIHVIGFIAIISILIIVTIGDVQRYF